MGSVQIAFTSMGFFPLFMMVLKLGAGMVEHEVGAEWSLSVSFVQE